MVDENKVISTALPINGEVFELQDMTAERGKQLYTALKGLKGADGQPTKVDYQKLADQMAQLALSFQSVVSLGGPSDMPIADQIKEVFKAIKARASGATDESAAWVSDFLNTSAGKALSENPAIQSAESAVSFFQGIGKFASGFGKGFVAIPNGTGKAWDATKGTASEVWNMTDGQINADQARAYGAAYAAAFYAETEAPFNPNTANLKPSWVDYGVTGVQYGWDWVASNVPFMAAVMPFIGKLFSNGFDWSKAWSEAMAEAKVTHPETGAEFWNKENFTAAVNKHMIENVEKNARGTAAKILTASETVAGISTLPLAQVIEHGGIYRDHKGAWNTLEFKGGAPTVDAVKNDKGAPVTGGSNVGDKWQDFADTVTPDLKSKMGTAGFIAGGAAGLDVGAGFVRGAMSKMVGKNSVSAAQYEKLMKPVEDLLNQAKELRTQGPVTKTDWRGNVLERGPLDPVKATQLEIDASVKEAELAATTKPFANRMALRKELFGKFGQNIAETEGFWGKVFKPAEFLTKGAGQYDPFNRVGAALGKPTGWVGSQVLTGLETGAITRGSVKGAYLVEGFQLGMSMLATDGHGTVEHGGKLGGAVLGSKYAKLGAEKAFALAVEKDLIAAAPGRYKIIAAGVGLLGMAGGWAGGRWGGEKINGLLGLQSNEEMVKQVDQSVQQFAAINDQLLKQAIIATNTSEASIERLRDLPKDAKGQQALVEQLQREKVLPADLPRDQQMRALVSLQSMVGLQDKMQVSQTKIVESLERQKEVSGALSSPEVQISMNTMIGTGSLLAKFSKVAPIFLKGGGKFLPGPIATGSMAIGDGYETIVAATEGDTKKVVHGTARVSGGILGAIGMGMGTGAVLGAPGMGIGAIPGAIIGGVAGAVGYYGGSEILSYGADKIYGLFASDKVAPTPTGQQLAATPKNTVDNDAAVAQLHQQAIESHQRTAEIAKARKEAVEHMAGIKKVVSVKMGGVVTAPPGAMPNTGFHGNREDLQLTV